MPINLLEDIVEDIDAKITQLRAKLTTLQNTDGGFKGFYCHDKSSGVWTTAEIVHVVSKIFGTKDNVWLQNGCNYLLRYQNEDGGWPFRAGGKSITDITAWCCLTISHFGYQNNIKKGIEFILTSRNNEGPEKGDAWGLTTYEPDRVYSTWIASYCLTRFIRNSYGDELSPLFDDMSVALTQAKSWLLQIKNDDGSWGTTNGSPPHYTSTALALLTLFMQGENPINFTSSYKFLLTGLRNGLWIAEDETVITKEGYELTQQWFTSAVCFRAIIFFAELGVASISEIDNIFNHFIELISQDGSVKIMPQSSADLIWSIPYMMDTLAKYKAFILSKQREYRIFLEQKQEKLIQAKKQVIENILQLEFPYPVSHVFFTYQHDLDYHRKFQLMLQIYEVTIKNTAVIGLSGYLAAKEINTEINTLLTERFKRPSLGDWGTLLELLLKDSIGFNRLLHPLTGEDILKNRRSYLDASAAKTNLHQVISDIISLRNSNTGHGAIRTLYEYKLMIDREESGLYSFLDRMSFLSRSNSFLVLASQYDEFGEGDKYKIRVFKGLHISDNNLETSNRLSEGQKDTMVRYIYFQNTSNNIIVNLYPFLSYMFCEECKGEHFFFYNGTKGNDKITYLSYECGHCVDRNNGPHFQKRFEASEINW